MKSAGRNPTILVPGFAGGKMLFHPFRDEMRARGIAAEGWELAPILYRRPIAWYAERLGQTVLEHDARGLTLVGWSMGGFVSVAAALDPAVARRVRRIITFGTPWNGTWAARIAENIIRLFSTGTTLSSAAAATKVGGMSAGTFCSSDQRRMRSGEGLMPIRFFREGPCAKGSVMVTTGKNRPAKSGRAGFSSSSASRA